MSSENYTYRIRLIFTGVLVTEVIFWALYFIVTRAFGLTGRGVGEQLVYKHENVLYLLFLLIPIIGVYFYNIWQNNRMVDNASSRTARSFLRPVSSMSSFIKYFFFRNAFVFLVITMAQPVFGSKKVMGTSESLELVVALDVSNSMNTRDISENASRLEIAKRAIIQLINNLHGEKIGVSVFANSAVVHLPITTDYSTSKIYVDEIETEMVRGQGTNINAALLASMAMFSEQKTTKGIILITDGENHEENPSETLKELREKRIQLSVLGIGTQKGGLVPNNPYRPDAGYKTDARGKTIVSKLDERFIRKIATEGGGQATTSSSEFPDLSALLTEINQMKRTKIDTLEFDIKQERYQVPLFISILFWIAFVLWSRQYVGILDNLIKK